jgi:glycosyltransferase involved in cell wall biosynthesis
LTILTSGYVAESEGVREAAEAMKRVGLEGYHLGPPMNLGSHVRCLLGMGDETLARMYSECKYVAGLRRVEGFELPAAEGLLCGARPILFDAPHYRDWFHRWGIFIPEGDSAQVTDSLEDIFRRLPDLPVEDGEIAEARKLFDWGRIIPAFWSEVLA